MRWYKCELLSPLKALFLRQADVALALFPSARDVYDKKGLLWP